MRTIDAAALDAAEGFTWRSARLVDRLRFDHLVRGGPAERVVSAVLAYQNPDGGFGQALEPDFRGPTSQPLATETGLAVLAEVGAFDRPAVGAAYDWLATVTTAEGGVPNVLADVVGYPRAPWWSPQGTGDQPPSILPTATLVAHALAQGLEHPWVAPAAAWCWEAVDRLAADAPQAGPQDLATIGYAYQARAAVAFLDHAPDRPRAEAAAAALGRAVRGAGAAALEPGAPGELLGPLDLAPRPGSLALAWFGADVVGAHLDALVADQRDDGGWVVGWAPWAPVTELEWRGWQTVERLAALAAWGRVDGLSAPPGPGS